MAKNKAVSKVKGNKAASCLFAISHELKKMTESRKKLQHQHHIIQLEYCEEKLNLFQFSTHKISSIKHIFQHQKQNINVMM